MPSGRSLGRGLWCLRGRISIVVGCWSFARMASVCTSCRAGWSSRVRRSPRPPRGEVGVQIGVEDLRPEVVVSAPAHGRLDVTVVIAVHVGSFRGVPEARGEIAEIGWVSRAPHDVNQCAEAIRRVAEHFVSRGQLTLRG